VELQKCKKLPKFKWWCNFLCEYCTVSSQRVVWWLIVTKYSMCYRPLPQLEVQSSPHVYVKTAVLLSAWWQWLAGKYILASRTGLTFLHPSWNIGTHAPPHPTGQHDAVFNSCARNKLGQEWQQKPVTCCPPESEDEPGQWSDRRGPKPLQPRLALAARMETWQWRELKDRLSGSRQYI
jgi:hypothetical protein